MEHDINAMEITTKYHHHHHQSYYPQRQGCDLNPFPRSNDNSIDGNQQYASMRSAFPSPVSSPRRVYSPMSPNTLSPFAFKPEEQQLSPTRLSVNSDSSTLFPPSPCSSSSCPSPRSPRSPFSNSDGLKPLENEQVSTKSLNWACRWKRCTRKFYCQKDLANHVNDDHVRTERPDADFQCLWKGCPRQGRGFNARYKMLIHIRTHTNEKPHKCKVCGKCFSRLENLKIHTRSHTGEKPYVCTFSGCGKAYSNSSDRFKHVRTHQEEKPYKCRLPGCKKQYTDPSSLRKHVRTHRHCGGLAGANLYGRGDIVNNANDTPSKNAFVFRELDNPEARHCNAYMELDIRDSLEKCGTIESHNSQYLDIPRNMSGLDTYQVQSSGRCDRRRVPSLSGSKSDLEDDHYTDNPLSPYDVKGGNPLNYEYNPMSSSISADPNLFQVPRIVINDVYCGNNKATYDLDTAFKKESTSPTPLSTSENSETCATFSIQNQLVLKNEDVKRNEQTINAPKTHTEQSMSSNHLNKTNDNHTTQGGSSFKGHWKKRCIIKNKAETENADKSFDTSKSQTELDSSALPKAEHGLQKKCSSSDPPEIRQHNVKVSSAAFYSNKSEPEMHSSTKLPTTVQSYEVVRTENVNEDVAVSSERRSAFSSVKPQYPVYITSPPSHYRMYSPSTHAVLAAIPPVFSPTSMSPSHTDASRYYSSFSLLPSTHHPSLSNPSDFVPHACQVDPKSLMQIQFPGIQVPCDVNKWHHFSNSLALRELSCRPSPSYHTGPPTLRFMYPDVPVGVIPSNILPEFHPLSFTTLR